MYMKVAYVVAYSKGGLAHYAIELANSIVKINKNIEIIFLKPNDLDNKLLDSSIKCYSVFKPIAIGNSWYSVIKDNLSAIYSFKNIKILNDLNPDLVHIHSFLSPLNYFIRKYNITKKYPIIVTLHALYTIYSKHKLSDLVYPIHLNIRLTELTSIDIIKSAQKIVVHTYENKREWVKVGFDKEKITVIPHGAYNFFKNKYLNTTESIEYTYNKKCILYFGFIRRIKGIEYLIEAMKFVWDVYPHAKLIIAGEGDFKLLHNYNKIKSLLNDKRIEIINKYIPEKDIPKLFTKATLVVLPYIYHQGHSGVLTIAFSFGKPVVVTNVGNLPELVKNGREGLVVPPKDPKALADAIIKILEDDKLRKKMSRNALKKAEELSWNNIAKEYIKVYEEVIAERRSK